jgi:tRNA A37 threonylcarbamoyladenosine dehydratase
VAHESDRCQREGLCYLAVHCHGGTNSVRFSTVDIESHERGYPALLEINEGRPVGGLVFAKNAVAGDIWTPTGRYPLRDLTVIGPSIRKYYPESNRSAVRSEYRYDRTVRMIGDHGQAILSELKIGLIGVGGAGSILSELLSKLGVGHIIAIDFEKVDITNLPRIVGSTNRDAMAYFSESRFRIIRALAKKMAKYKVHVSRRVAKNGNSKIRYEAVVGDLCDAIVAHKLTDVDFLFLASDSMQCRVIFNALVYQYLIPGMQVGAKISIDETTDEITDIFTTSRPVLPMRKGGCLKCHQLILGTKLQSESISSEERNRQRYVDSDEVPVPSVITLNSLATSQAANDFMMMFTGLFYPDVELFHRLQFTRSREISQVEPVAERDCLYCGDNSKSRRARGDYMRLPCRMPAR